MRLVSGKVLERWNTLSDAQITAHVLAGRTALFEVLIRRHNERVYRIVRAVVGADSTAEELVQQVFVDAYANLPHFDRRSHFANWVTRLALKTTGGAGLAASAAHGARSQCSTSKKTLRKQGG